MARGGVEGGQATLEQQEGSQAALVLLSDGVDHFDHGPRRQHPIEIAPHIPVRLDHGHLGDRVKVETLVKEQVEMGEWLEAPPEPALGAPNTLGDGADLAVVGAEQHDDAVGLPEREAPEHDSLVAAEAHGVRLPAQGDSAGNRDGRIIRPKHVANGRTDPMPRRVFLAVVVLLLAFPTLAFAQVPDDIIEPPIPPCPWWDCGNRAEVVVEEYRVDTLIDAGVATTRVRQVLRNDSDFVAEGEFLFPIPPAAVVTGMTLWIDGEPV